MASLVRSVIFNVVGRDAASGTFFKVAKAADIAASSVDRSAKRMYAASARMQGVGAKMSKAITLPVVAAAAVSVDQAAKFQKSMVLIETATGEFHSNMGLVAKGIEDIAKSTGTNLGQLSNGMYLVEKAGFRGANGLTVLKAAAQGAKAENVDLSVATTALTSIMTSYHLSASGAVQAENMLIRGSGLAKTTMTDFASSLSNVVPLAAALGIKLPQVFGAIDTMTQHGETAQRATENLSNLITNLAGSNNVATSAMSQLGIKVVDLQKNLGSRGLYGTLQVVLNALKAHGKSGLVVYDSFKRAALGTHSLHLEMSKMTGPLLVNSKALLSGNMGLKAYQAYAKSMGGQAGVMALQFMASVKSILGFNNLLKSGRGDTQTYAKALQTALGGMTGLKAVLMLMGGSFDKTKSKTDTFRQSIDLVARAARNSGADVLNWTKTQGTLSNKIDRAKASLQVMAVEVGMALIPAVTKLVQIVQGAVHWFDGLSGTQKKIVGWSIAIIAALGPVLAIIGRVGKAISGLWLLGSGAVRLVQGILGVNVAIDTMNSKVWQSGFKIREAFTGMSTAAKGFVRGLGALSVGAIAGQVSGGGTGGWLESIMLGGLGGWAVGGGNPVFAAIGAVSGAISHGIKLWSDHSAAAKAATQAEMQYVNQLTSAIESDSGAIGKNTRLFQIKQLGQAGVLAHASSLHIPLTDVVNASLGQGTGKLSKDVLGAEARLIARQKAIQSQIDREDSKAQPNGDLLKRDKERISSINDQIKGVEKLKAALLKMGIDVGKGQQAWKLEFDALNDVRKASGGYADQLKELRTQQTIAENTDSSYMTALKGTGDAAKHNRSVILNLAAAAQTDAEKVFSAKVRHEGWRKALEDSRVTLANHIKAIMGAAKAAGFNTKSVAALIAGYKNLPRNVQLYITKHGVLPKDIQDIVDAENRLHDKTITITVNGQTAGNLSSTYNSQVPVFHNARGGPVRDGYFTVGEQGYELGHKRGNKVTIFDNKTSQRMTGMSRVPGFAKGSGSGKVAGYVPPDPNAAASAATSAQNNITSALDAIRSFLTTARNLSAAATDLRGGASSLIDAAKNAKVSTAGLAAESVLLGRLGRARDRITARLGTAPTAPTAYDRLGTAQGAYSGAISSTRSAFTGGVDITSLGQNSWGVASAGGILGQLRTMAANARKFTHLIRKLAKEGLNRALVEQLANAGPSALGAAEALAAATPAQLHSINASYKAVSASGGALGTTVAHDYYLAGVKSAQAMVNGLKSRRSLLNKAITGLADSMVHTLEARLGVNSTGGKVSKLDAGARTLQVHFHINGITDPEAFARAVARRLSALVA